MEDEIQAGVPPVSLTHNVHVQDSCENMNTTPECRVRYTTTQYLIWFLLVFLLQGGSLLASPFLKGFLAGYIVAKLRSSALLGVAIGTCTGIFAAQSYVVPNIENTVRDYITNLKAGRKWEEEKKRGGGWETSSRRGHQYSYRREQIRISKVITLIHRWVNRKIVVLSDQLLE